MTDPAAHQRALADYLAQTPPRSLERLVERYRSGTEVGPPTRRLGTLKEWSRRYGWQERVREHEAQIAREAADRLRAERLADLERRRARRLKGADSVRDIAMDALADLLPDEPADVVRMLKYADDTERLETGEATSRVDVDIVDVDVSELSDAELDALIAGRVGGTATTRRRRARETPPTTGGNTAPLPG